MEKKDYLRRMEMAFWSVCNLVNDRMPAMSKEDKKIYLQALADFTGAADDLIADINKTDATGKTLPKVLS